jgi:tRNA nucleotidyltransferase (CCA-adding enzyme)
MLVRSDDSKYISWILAALVPWSAIPNPQQTGSKAPPIFGARVAQEGIKATSKICSLVNGAFKNYAQITHLKNAVVHGQTFIHERDTIGMSIRKWDADGGNWRIQSLFALLVEVMDRAGTHGVPIATIFCEWQELIDHLEKMDIIDAPAEKPLVNGTMLMRELNAKGGPWTKTALDICMAWQLRNPNATGPKAQKDAIEEVRRRSKELKIPVKE